MNNKKFEQGFQPYEVYLVNVYYFKDRTRL